MANSVNRKAILELPDYKNDWLILAGDTGETEKHLEFSLSILKEKFEKIIWTPGNHDLWTISNDKNALKGYDKYKKLVAICHKYEVQTPEDDFVIYKHDDKQYCIAPVMTLYDYSFKEEYVKLGDEKKWAAESGVFCADEELLDSYPFETISHWSNQRCSYTEKRLNEVQNEIPLIIVNHYPLIKELGKIYTFPRFSIWCGTTNTQKWLDKFNIEIVIYGHLHIRSTKIIGGIRHEEVSLGYPNDWDNKQNMKHYLRKIL